MKVAAHEICNTLKQYDISGEKERVEASGEVSLEVGKILKKLGLSAGASMESNLLKESFKGLSRESTAELINEDRKCRERIFQNMFNQYYKIREGGLGYDETKRRSDIRIVRNYISNPRFRNETEYSPRNSSGLALDCSYLLVGSVTADLIFDQEEITLININHLELNECNDSNKPKKTFTRHECKVNKAKLDEAFGLIVDSESHFSTLLIGCLSNYNCARCIEKSPNKKVINNIPINPLRIYLGRSAFTSKYRVDTAEFMRALARLITQGEDEAMCKNIPQLCSNPESFSPYPNLN